MAKISANPGIIEMETSLEVCAFVGDCTVYGAVDVRFTAIGIPSPSWTPNEAPFCLRLESVPLDTDNLFSTCVAD